MLGWFGQIGRLWVIYSKADLGWIDRGKSGSVYAASSRICTQPSPADASYPQGSSTCILEQQRRKKVEGDQMTGSWVSHFKCFFFWLTPGKYFRDLRRLCVDMIEQPCHCFVNICLIARLAFCPTGTAGNSWWKRNFFTFLWVLHCGCGPGLLTSKTTYDCVWPCAPCQSHTITFSWKTLFIVVQGIVNRCGWIIEWTNQGHKSVSGFCEWQTHSGTPYTLESKVWKLIFLYLEYK